MSSESFNLPLLCGYMCDMYVPRSRYLRNAEQQAGGGGRDGGSGSTVVFVAGLVVGLLIRGAFAFAKRGR